MSRIWTQSNAPMSAAPGDTWQYVAPAVPKAVIWSTDWWTDVDDAVAARLLLHAERIGLIDIRAAVISGKLAKGPGALDALFQFEGRRGIPIGMDATYVPSGAPAYQANLFDKNYHDVGYQAGTNSSTDVMRRTLAAADNGEIVVIEVGYHTNLQKLLQSGADSISPLTGLQLVQQKVRELWVMGGNYPTEGLTSNNFARDATAMAAANYVFANWPGTIICAGGDIGNDILLGGSLQGTATQDPLAQALVDHGSAAGRAAWDPMLTWAACLDDLDTAGYTLTRGTNSVASGTGINTFTETPTSGNHYYMTKSAPDRWYATDLERRLRPNSYFPPAVPYSLRGVSVAAQEGVYVPRTPVALPARTTGALASGLILHVHADDLAGLTNGNAVAHWEDRMRRNHVRQVTVANQPTFQSAIGGLTAVQFAGGNVCLATDWLDEKLGPYFTVFAKVQWAVLPTSTQDIVSADLSYSQARRVFHLAAFFSGANNVLSVAWEKGTFASKFNTTTPAMVINTWYNVALRVRQLSASQDRLDGYLNGTATTPTDFAGGLGPVTARIVLGNRYADTPGTEPFVGYLHEARVYDYALSDADVASVFAAM